MTERNKAGQFVAPDGLNRKSRGRGRPKGRKNNLTLLREAEQKKVAKAALGMMALELPDIVQAIVTVAKDPEHRHWPIAAKLAMGPFVEAVKEGGSNQGLNVQINITGVEHAQATQQEPDQGRVHGDGPAPTARVIDAEGWSRSPEPAGGPPERVHGPDGDPPGT